MSVYIGYYYDNEVGALHTSLLSVRVSAEGKREIRRWLPEGTPASKIASEEAAGMIRDEFTTYFNNSTDKYHSLERLIEVAVASELTQLLQVYISDNDGKYLEARQVNACIDALTTEAANRVNWKKDSDLPLLSAFLNLKSKRCLRFESKSDLDNALVSYEDRSRISLQGHGELRQDLLALSDETTKHCSAIHLCMKDILSSAKCGDSVCAEDGAEAARDGGGDGSPAKKRRAKEKTPPPPAHRPTETANRLLMNLIDALVRFFNSLQPELCQDLPLAKLATLLQHYLTDGRSSGVFSKRPVSVVELRVCVREFVTEHCTHTCAYRRKRRCTSFEYHRRYEQDSARCTNRA